MYGQYTIFYTSFSSIQITVPQIKFFGLRGVQLPFNVQLLNGRRKELISVENCENEAKLKSYVSDSKEMLLKRVADMELLKVLKQELSTGKG